MKNEETNEEKLKRLDTETVKMNIETVKMNIEGDIERYIEDKIDEFEKKTWQNVYAIDVDLNLIEVTVHNSLEKEFIHDKVVVEFKIRFGGTR